MTGEGVQTIGAVTGQIAVVTGASSGIGRAISIALSRNGVKLCLVGRDSVSLAEAVAEASVSSKATGFQLDLIAEGNVHPLLRYLEEQGKGIDILVHSAGVIHQARMAEAHIEDFDLQYATNVRAPYVLTQFLLPLLTIRQGQIVFINSSAGLNAKRPDVGQYSATKHAMKAVADSLREEVNPKGIRVLSVYPGRTATPMQAALYRLEGQAYQPETLLQPEDVASVIIQALMLPRTAEVTDISIRPMIKTRC